MDRIARIFCISLSFILLWGLMTYSEHYQNINISYDSSEHGYEIIDDYEYEKVISADRNNPLERYSFSLGKAGPEYRTLVFFTAHQNVEVFIGNQVIYTMRQIYYSPNSYDPGYVWNYVVLPKEVISNTLTIQIEGVFESSVERPITIYYGNKSEIRNHIIRKALVSDLLLSSYCVFVGIIYVIFGYYTLKKKELSGEMIHIGFLAICIGLWKFFDCNASVMIFESWNFITPIPFAALILMPIPALCFIKNLFRNKDHIIWSITMGVCALNSLVCTILQLYNVFEFYEMRMFIHGSLLVAVLGIVVMIIYEAIEGGIGKQLKKNLIMFAVFLCGIGIDLLVYYFQAGTGYMVAGMICFAAYITMVGANVLKDFSDVLVVQQTVEQIENIAYHDQLTKVFNRTAYNEDITADTFKAERCFVAVFDLNNLKKCNDELGHEVGDFYIKEGARIIQESFEPMGGKIYRMGGDEFCALIRNGSYDKVVAAMRTMKEKVAIANLKQTMVNISIAGGFDHYDVRTDYDINDTYKRADKKMYIEKFEMKKAEMEAAKLDDSEDE